MKNKELLLKDKKENEQEQVNNQHNKQDLDQEQNVSASPFQFNNQNINVIVNNDYSGKIMGVTYIEGNKKLLADVEISLFPGDNTWTPICKTKSDENGSYKIEELPPGFYTLIAKLGRIYEYKSQYVKVMVGQSVYQSIPLKSIVNKNDLESRKKRFYQNSY